MMKCECCGYTYDNETVLLGRPEDSFVCRFMGQERGMLALSKAKFIILDDTDIVKCPQCNSIFHHKTKEIINNTTIHNIDITMNFSTGGSNE